MVQLITCRQGVNTVFVTLPFKPSNFDEHFPRFLKACETAHVKRILKLSFYHSTKSKAAHLSQHFGDPPDTKSVTFHDVPFVHKHALCDGDLVLHGQFDVTLLFASHLMSNVFRYGVERKALKDNHEFYGASGGKGVNYVSPNDVADVVVKAIFEKSHKRQAFTLTGPTAITDEEVAQLLSKLFGTKITYVEAPLDFFDEDTAALERIKATGVEENANFVKHDFKNYIQRDPESFEDYLMATHRMSLIEQEGCGWGHPVKEVKEVAPAKEDVEEIENIGDVVAQ